MNVENLFVICIALNKTYFYCTSFCKYTTFSTKQRFIFIIILTHVGKDTIFSLNLSLKIRYTY